MGPRGPNVEDVKAVKAAVGAEVRIKAAGGINTYDEANGVTGCWRRPPRYQPCDRNCGRPSIDLKHKYGVIFPKSRRILALAFQFYSNTARAAIAGGLVVSKLINQNLFVKQPTKTSKFLPAKQLLRVWKL